MQNYVVRNEKNMPCLRCGKTHDYLTRMCTPVTFNENELTPSVQEFGQWHLPPDGMATIPFGKHQLRVLEGIDV